MLRCELTTNGQGAWKVKLPEALWADWNGSQVLHIHASRNGAASHLPSDGESSESEAINTFELSPDSKLFQWTIDKLRSHSPVNTVPQSQPAGVHEITPELFSQFTFDDGHIHLAGCALEDRPVIRLTLQSGEADANATLRHLFFWPDGEFVEQELISQLTLDQLQALETRPPQRELDKLQETIEAAQASIQEQGDDVIAVTVIWCKFAEGKIAFEAGEETVYVPFSGWATLLAKGLLRPEPYDCPLTHLKGYNLAVTDDGRIAAADGIGTCEETGQRMLLADMDRCTATGKRVELRLLAPCRVSGKPVLATSLVNCEQCGQKVSPNALKGSRCSACRSLAPIRKDDPRMARLLDEYPKLDSWPRWRIAETETVYVLLATSWLRQLSIVVDKESLDVSHIAVSGRLITNWLELSTAQREELLG